MISLGFCGVSKGVLTWLLIFQNDLLKGPFRLMSQNMVRQLATVLIQAIDHLTILLINWLNGNVVINLETLTSIAL